MRAELVEHSMLMATPLYEVGGEIVPGLQRPPVIEDSTDQVYVVPRAGSCRFDLISQLFYNTPDLWWVIAQVNNVVDPLCGIESGTAVRIPTRARLSKIGVLNG